MIYSSPNLAANVLDTLNEFRIKNQFCDVVINLNGNHHFPAHKAVLLASSGYFRKVLPKNKEKLLIVKLSLSRPETFFEVLTYLYTGTIDLTEPNLAEIVLVGKYLQVTEISKLTDKFIQRMQASDLEDDCETVEETEEDIDLLEISNDDVQSLDSRTGIVSCNDDIETDPRIAETGDYKLRGKTFSPAKEKVNSSTPKSATGRVRKRKYTKKASIKRNTHDSFRKILKGRPPASEYHQMERELIKLHEQDILFLPEVNRYQCAICEKLFSSASNCSRHYRRHTGEKPFECQYCRGKFTRLDTLQKHLDFCQKSNTGLDSQVNAASQNDPAIEGILPSKTCPVCSKGLRTAKGYKNHIGRHYVEKQIDGKTIFSCQTCDTICYSTDKIIDHCQQCWMFTCKYCRRVFKSKVNLERHVRIHTGERPFTCPICDLAFTRGDSLFTHLSENTAFIRCGQKAKEQGINVFELVSETKKRITSEARAYQIPIEDQAWDLQNQLANINRETKTPYFKCDKCIASFFEFTHFSEHRKEHGLAEEMKCPICHLTFTREAWLNKHMELHESDIQTSDQADFTHPSSTFFMCQICERVFDNETEYVSHNTVMCADTCRFCQRPYQTRKCLEQHIKKHTGEKPFVCHLCDDKFSSRRELKSHLADEHMIETPKHSRLEPLPTVVVLHGDMPNDCFQIEGNEINVGPKEKV